MNEPMYDSQKNMPKCYLTKILIKFLDDLQTMLIINSNKIISTWAHLLPFQRANPFFQKLTTRDSYVVN